MTQSRLSMTVIIQQLCMSFKTVMKSVKSVQHFQAGGKM